MLKQNFSAKSALSRTGNQLPGSGTLPSTPQEAICWRTWVKGVLPFNFQGGWWILIVKIDNMSSYQIWMQAITLCNWCFQFSCFRHCFGLEKGWAIQETKTSFPANSGLACRELQQLHNNVPGFVNILMTLRGPLSGEIQGWSKWWFNTSAVSIQGIVYR